MVLAPSNVDLLFDARVASGSKINLGRVAEPLDYIYNQCMHTPSLECLLYNVNPTHSQNRTHKLFSNTFFDS